MVAFINFFLIDFVAKQFLHSTFYVVFQFHGRFHRQEDYFKVVAKVIARDTAILKIIWSVVQIESLVYTDKVRCMYMSGIGRVVTSNADSRKKYCYIQP